MAIAARQGSVGARSTMGSLTQPRSAGRAGVKVFVAAEAEPQQEALTRVLRKNSSPEIVAKESRMPFDRAAMSGKGADILLLTSCGNFLEDLTVIRNVRVCQPNVEVVMLGKIGNDGEFLQCVRAGVRGYWSREAGPEEILQAIFEVRGGAAVCPGKLCAQLSRYFEAEAKSLPSASIHQRMRSYPPGTATNTPGGPRSHQQGNRQPLLAIRANRKKSLLSRAAQNRRGTPSQHRASLPRARLSPSTASLNSAAPT
jgi:DNA-binding NarL/FixJ family response regulator